MAPDGTPQNVASHLGLFCLLKGFSLRNGIKIHNHSNAPKDDSGLTQIMTIGKWFRKVINLFIASYFVLIVSQVMQIYYRQVNHLTSYNLYLP